MSDYESDDDEEVVEIGFQGASLGRDNNNLLSTLTSEGHHRPSFPSSHLEGGASPYNHSTDAAVASAAASMMNMNVFDGRTGYIGGGGGAAGGNISDVPVATDGETSAGMADSRLASFVGGPVSSGTASSSREIAIFWDLPGCPLPDWMAAEEAGSAICEAVTSRLTGRIVGRRLYVDHSSSGNAGLNECGFDVVNDFSEQQPGSSRRKLLVDLLCFGWDRTARKEQQQLLQQRPIDDIWVVLVTNDDVYSYALSNLRDRGVKCLLICNDGEGRQIQQQIAADVVLRFQEDVLFSVPRQHTGAGANVSGVNERPGSTYADRVVMDMGVTSSSPAVDQEWTTVTSTKQMIPSQVQILCRVLADGAKETIDTEDWVLGSKLGVLFRAAIASKATTSATSDIKESYKNARDTAIQKNLIERGFKYQGNGPRKNQIVPEKTNERWKEQGKLSKEDFFRLTKDGKQVLKTAAVSANTKSDAKRTNVFIKNIPKEMHVTAFVEALERDYDVDVLRGYYLPSNNTEVAYTFACLQVMTSQDTDRLLEASRKALLMAGGRVLACKINDGPYNSSAIDPKDEYRRPAGKPRQANVSAPSPRVETPLDQETNPALAYCRAVDAFLRQRTQNNIANLPDGWCDAGFWVQLKVALLGGDKDRVKAARSLALSKGWIEAGRRIVGTEGASIQIEAVEGTRNPARHALELYVRVTDVGTMQLGSTSTRFVPVLSEEGEQAESQSKLEDRLLFVKSLPPNVDVNTFVFFLESEFGLTINKAWVEEPKATASFTNAHLEMQSTKDALRMIHLASRAGEGIFFQRRPLEVVRDQRIPVFRKGDPRYYFRDGDALGARRMVLPRSQSKLDGSGDDNAAPGDIATVFCRVLRQKALTKGNDRTWINSGSVGEGFMRHFRNVLADQRKEMFAKARHSVISNGLVDFGRRILASRSQEVALATFMGKYDSSKLSSESYLRLTPKGANLVMSNSSVLAGQTSDITQNSTAKNGYFLNLPETAVMKDFVEYIEMTHGVKIRYGVMRRTPGFVSAQVEFMTEEDYSIVNESLTLQDGLDYEGSKVRMREDKGIPDWDQAKKSDARIFYEAEPEDEDLPPALLEEEITEPGPVPTDTIAIPRPAAKPNPITGDSLLSPDSAHRIISMLSFDMPEEIVADAIDSRVGGTAPAQEQDVFRQKGDEQPSFYGSTFGTDSGSSAQPTSKPSEADLFHMVWDDQTRSFRRVPISREALDRQMSQGSTMMRSSPADPAYLSSTPSPVPVQFRRVPDFEGSLNPTLATGFSDMPANPSQSLFPTQQAFNIHQPRPVFPSTSQTGMQSHFNRMPGPPGEQHGMMPGVGSNVGASSQQPIIRPGGPPPGIVGGITRGPPGRFGGDGSLGGVPQGGQLGIGVGVGGPPPPPHLAFTASHTEPLLQPPPSSLNPQSQPPPGTTTTTDTGRDESPGSKKWSDILKKS